GYWSRVIMCTLFLRYHCCILVVCHSFPTRRSSDLMDRIGFKPDLARTSARSGPGKGSRWHAWLPAALRGLPRSRPSPLRELPQRDRKSTRLNSSHVKISYAVFGWTKKILRRERNTR